MLSYVMNEEQDDPREVTCPLSAGLGCNHDSHLCTFHCSVYLVSLYNLMQCFVLPGWTSSGHLLRDPFQKSVITNGLLGHGTLQTPPMKY